MFIQLICLLIHAQDTQELFTVSFDAFCEHSTHLNECTFVFISLTYAVGRSLTHSHTHQRAH